nr:zinc finger, RING/FYVE/PHD-type, transmembrane fragile-X-F-associated protein [Tanacetum cinerariifolium]
MDNLDDEIDENWEAVVEKRNNSLSYSVKCCKPKDGGPLKYLSTTIFNNCSSEMLRDFYMDNYYRKEWDKTLIDQKQLHVDETNGTEFGSMIKKFPLLTPREYILAWRLWEGRDRTYYCYNMYTSKYKVPKLLLTCSRFL